MSTRDNVRDILYFRNEILLSFMQVLNIDWMWTSSNRSQIDEVSGGCGSYNSFIQFQVIFCVWKMKRWVITMSKVVVEIIWDNAVWIVFSRCHFLYKCELSVDVWNVFLVFHWPQALRQWCSTLAVYYNHLQHLKSVDIYVPPREILTNSSPMKPGPWHIGYSKVNAQQLLLLLFLFSCFDHDIKPSSPWWQST